MACHWRIRYKLVLGLGLVAGILALLLLGTLKGLDSYRATVNTFDSKLQELNALLALKEALSKLSDPKTARPDQLQELVQKARDALKAYDNQLKDTVIRGRDPDKGFTETGVIEALGKHFDELEGDIHTFAQSGVATQGPTDSSMLDPAALQAITELVRGTDQLYGHIYERMYTRIGHAKTDFKTTLGVVLSISIGGVLLMAGLLRFFYRWTFHPLRDLQAGVGRVALGDFEHSIEVHSGDEMEELADAFNDMTGRLREMYRDLARQVNERSRQLVRSERLASVGFLAAGVAHEINNPLASIAFCSEALTGRLTDFLQARSAGTQTSEVSKTSEVLRSTERGVRNASTEQDREIIFRYLKMIQDESFRCKGITERLLAFSRGGEQRRETTDLAKLIQSVLEVVQHLPSASGKKIVFPGTTATRSGVLTGNKLTAPVSAEEIKAVVLNLVINALDSMDDNGTLTIALRQRDGMAEMIFTDTGCGMAPEVLENIFEPFYTQNRSGKGTGLGLSISHRIVNQHRGEIEATSAGPGQGSTFTVRLPLQVAEAAPEEVRRAA